MAARRSWARPVHRPMELLALTEALKDQTPPAPPPSSALLFQSYRVRSLRRRLLDTNDPAARAQLRDDERVIEEPVAHHVWHQKGLALHAPPIHSRDRTNVVGVVSNDGTTIRAYSRKTAGPDDPVAAEESYHLTRDTSRDDGRVAVFHGRNRSTVTAPGKLPGYIEFDISLTFEAADDAGTFVMRKP
jgi:hypothetical protein